MFIHQSLQHKNLVIITDMEPDDHIAIALVLANGQLRERLRFIGTTLFNAKQKAEAVKYMLAGTSLSEIPVFVGTSQPPEGYPHLRSLEPAKQFAREEMNENARMEGWKWNLFWKGYFKCGFV
jgi:inosine-uridine nucleoside N-ribohydrolase